MEKYYLGVDVGGTKIAICGSNLLEKQEGIVKYPSTYSSSGEQDFVSVLLEHIDEYIREKEENCLPAAIGFGLKDAVDSKNGIWLKCPKGNGFYSVPLSEIISDHYGIPAALDNDVHVAALAELCHGAGKEYKNFLYINIGTGLSMCAIVEGTILRGTNNYAGEAGHMVVDPEGEVCSFCGQRGCWENIASGMAISENAIKAAKLDKNTVLRDVLLEKGTITASDVFAATEKGDQTAIRISSQVIRSTVQSTCALINVFNPEAVIFGGGVMADGWLLSKARPEILKGIIPTTAKALKEISLSSLGSHDVGLLGAISLAKQAI